MPGGSDIDTSVLVAEAHRLEKERMEEFLKTQGESQSMVAPSTAETVAKHGESFEKRPMTFIFS